MMKGRALSLLLVTLYTGVGLAMEAPASGADGQPIEEITVTGQRSMFELRLQVQDAEDAMFALFNEINTDDQYDVICTVETRVFSHVKERVCLPVYARDAQLDEAQNMVRGTPAIPLQATLSYSTPRFTAKFQELVGSNAELFSAVARHYELKELWRLRRQTHFGKDDE
ncbi:MAG: hypothetical protein RLZZ227_1274 [Pseudomonadota bacterium]|jgi:hypothetical protein